MRLSTLSKVVAIPAVMLFMLGCSILGTAVPQAGETPSVPLPSDGTTEELTELSDPRVEATLGLRSVQMELQAVIPGEDAVHTLISVDAEGNARIESALPTFEDSMVTQESPDWNVIEIFIVAGQAYVRTGKSGSAESDLEQNDALSETLYSPTSPGLWLIMLPEESFTPGGVESKGGFDALKYTVEGMLEMGAIQGEFWVDEPTGALVGANLTLAESIFRPMDESADGVVTIIFTVEKAVIPAITVP